MFDKRKGQKFHVVTTLSSYCVNSSNALGSENFAIVFLTVYVKIKGNIRIFVYVKYRQFVDNHSAGFLEQQLVLPCIVVDIKENRSMKQHCKPLSLTFQN